MRKLIAELHKLHALGITGNEVNGLVDRLQRELAERPES
jgi:hypothetical protein